MREWYQFSGLITKEWKENPMQSRVGFNNRLKIALPRLYPSFLTPFCHVLHFNPLLLSHEAKNREYHKTAVETCSTVYTSEYYAVPVREMALIVKLKCLTQIFAK